jgi:hypothetical protein
MILLVQKRQILLVESEARGRGRQGGYELFEGGQRARQHSMHHALAEELRRVFYEKKVDDRLIVVHLQQSFHDIECQRPPAEQQRGVAAALHLQRASRHALDTVGTACLVSDLTGSSSPYDRIQLPGVFYDAHERQRDTVTVCCGNHGAKERVEEVEVGAEED